MKRQLFLSVLLTSSLIALAQQPSTTNSADSLSAALDSLYFGQQELKEVTVSAQRKYVKQDIDRISYQVSQDPEAKTKMLIDILRKTPLVTVDGRDEVSVRGSSDFKVYRNGRPHPSFSSGNLKDIIKAIPASTIRRIEVITDPGAREDGEGAKYIINIVTRDTGGMQGFTGSVGGGINNLGSHGQSLYLAAQKGKFIISADYTHAFQTGRYSRQINENDFIATTTGKAMKDHFETEQPLHYHMGNLSASYDIDSLNLVTLAVGGQGYSLDMDYKGYADQWNADGSLDYHYDLSMKLPNYSFYNINGRADYQHKTHRDGEVLTISYMLNTTHKKDDRDFTMTNVYNSPTPYSKYLQGMKENFVEHTGQIDYVRPLGKIWKMEYGAKYIKRSNKSRTLIDYYGSIPTTDSHFNHSTQVAAAYTEWMMHSGKWSAQAGVRYEHSRMKGTYPKGESADFSTRLNDLLPSASLRYAFADNHSLKMSYGTNIYRPGISYLNPAERKMPSSVEYGNPNLESAYVHSFDIEWSYSWPRLNLMVMPFLNISNNMIGDHIWLDGDILVQTYDDVNHRCDIGSSIYLQAQPWRGASLVVNVVEQYRKYSNSEMGYKLDGWAGSGNISFSQKLPWKLYFSANAGGQWGRKAQSVFIYDGNGYYNNFALQRSFLKNDCLTVQINANDLIGRHELLYQLRYINGDAIGVHNFRQNHFGFGLRVTYRFGRLGTSAKKVSKSISNTDEIGGVKQ